MSRQQERGLVKKAYPKSKTWASKVDRMGDDQVVAIYLRFKRQGKI